MNNALESLVSLLAGIGNQGMIACGREGRTGCLLKGRTNYLGREEWGGMGRQERPPGGRRFRLGPEECVGAHQVDLHCRFTFTQRLLTH